MDRNWINVNKQIKATDDIIVNEYGYAYVSIWPKKKIKKMNCRYSIFLLLAI